MKKSLTAFLSNPVLKKNLFAARLRKYFSFLFALVFAAGASIGAQYVPISAGSSPQFDSGVLNGNAPVMVHLSPVL